MNGKSAPLGIRKVERPRPLRSISHIGIPSGNSNLANSSTNRRMSAQDVSNVEEVIQLLDQVKLNLAAKNYEKSTIQSIIKLNTCLKSYGSQVEMFHRDLLDKAQVTLRNACKDTSLDIVARLHILEIIELRSMKWVLTESVINYYKQKLSMFDYEDSERQKLNVNAPLFMPTTQQSGLGGNILDQLLPNQNVSSVIPNSEVMISSGKYSGPTQAQGKTYFKDEVVIRNADSGKVLSGSVDRLVQITSSVPTNIAQAKVLMEDTIRRNQSPAPDFVVSDNKVTSTTFDTEFKFSVKVGDETIKISSTNLQLVKTAKIVLDEYFVHNPNQVKMTVSRQPLFPDSTKEAFDLAENLGGHGKQRRENFAKTHYAKSTQPIQPKYDREFILKCSKSPFCTQVPPNWQQVIVEHPELIKVSTDGPPTNPLEQRFTSFAKLMESCKVWDETTGTWTSRS